MDLAVWWRSRRWKALLELIDQLPANSRFNEATLNDPEQAELIAHKPGSGERWTPRIAEWDIHAIQLRDLIHAVLAVRSALIGVHTGKASRVEEWPSPVTEVDRAVARAVRASVERTLVRFGFDPTDL